MKIDLMKKLSPKDHLGCFGNFDIVPELTGEYDELIKTAVRRIAFGHRVWVSHIDDLLARLTVPRRDKDISLVRELRKIQHLLQMEMKREESS